MPRTSLYTLAARQLAHLGAPARADLHVHTTNSDGDYTPSQVVALARQAGLRAVAVTDHDTLAGIAEAREAAGAHLELVPGVEISTRFGGRELHLLGYFVRTDHTELNAALARICASRRERFLALVALLAGRGVNVPADRVRLMEQGSASLGRRHVANLVLACGGAGTRTEAFHRFVNPLVAQAGPKALPPIEEAIRLVRAAGGVSSLAHPPEELLDADYAALQEAGLNALEVAYPWGRQAPQRKLREVADRFGFAVSGGSDCHGPDPAHRRIGTTGITPTELDALRGRAGCAAG